MAASALKADGRADRADDGRFRLGAGVSIVAPTGGNLKSGPGFGPVFTAEMKLTDRQLLRGMLEYVHFRESGMYAGLETGEHRQCMNRLKLEADWVYSFNSNNRGPYVLGGVGFVDNAWKSVQLDRSGDLHSGSHNKFDPVLVVGGGYAFRWLAVEHTRSYDFAGRLTGSTWEIRNPFYGKR